MKFKSETAKEIFRVLDSEEGLNDTLRAVKKRLHRMFFGAGSKKDLVMNKKEIKNLYEVLDNDTNPYYFKRVKKQIDNRLQLKEVV